MHKNVFKNFKVTSIVALKKSKNDVITGSWSAVDKMQITCPLLHRTLFISKFRRPFPNWVVINGEETSVNSVLPECKVFILFSVLSWGSFSSQCFSTSRWPFSRVLQDLVGLYSVSPLSSFFPFVNCWLKLPPDQNYNVHIRRSIPSFRFSSVGLPQLKRNG